MPGGKPMPGGGCMPGGNPGGYCPGRGCPGMGMSPWGGIPICGIMGGIICCMDIIGGMALPGITGGAAANIVCGLDLLGLLDARRRSA